MSITIIVLVLAGLAAVAFVALAVVFGVVLFVMRSKNGKD